MSALAALEQHFRPIGIPKGYASFYDEALSGIYLLIRNDEIVYVGASKNMQRRIYVHGIRPRRLRFNRAMCLPLPTRVLPFYEGALLRELAPRYNKSIPASRRAHDAEILYGFGLRETLTEDQIYLKDHADWPPIPDTDY